MLYLLNPRVWGALVVLVVLLFTHTFSYRAGRAAVQAKWNQQIAAQQAAALKAEQQARAHEQELVEARQQAEKRYVDEKQKAARAAAGAQSELDRLRDAIAQRDAQLATQTAPAPAGADAGARLELQLLGSCAAALVGVAAEADRLAAQVIGLQGYVTQVCQKP